MDQIPPHLISLEGDDYINYQAAIAEIESTCTRWERGEKYRSRNIQGIDKRNALAVLHEKLSLCSDFGIHESTPELLFIKDVSLRETLLIDISEANNALKEGGWKSSTVLSGSIIEAILLYELKENTDNDNNLESTIKSLSENENGFGKIKNNKLEDCNLYQLIALGEKLDIISNDTADQCKLAKNYRNLIHPGREIRKKQTCNRGTALAAMAAVELIITCLNKKHP